LCGVNLPLRTYMSELGCDSPPIAAASSPIAWRSSVGFRTPLATGMRAVDGYFRWSDPLPALYYYAYERCVARIQRRAVRALTNRTAPL